MGRGKPDKGRRKPLYGHRRRRARHRQDNERARRAIVAFERGQAGPMVELLSGDFADEMAPSLLEAIGHGPTLSDVDGSTWTDEDLGQLLRRASFRLLSTMVSPFDVTQQQLRDAVDFERERLIIKNKSQSPQWMRNWGRKYGNDLLYHHGFGCLSASDLLVGMGQGCWAENQEIQKGRRVLKDLVDLEDPFDLVVGAKEELLKRVEHLRQGVKDDLPAPTILAAMTLTLNEHANLQAAEALVAEHGAEAWPRLAELAWTASGRDRETQEVRKSLNDIARHLDIIRQDDPGYLPNIAQMAVCIAQINPPAAGAEQWRGAELIDSILTTHQQARRPVEKLLSWTDLDSPLAAKDLLSPEEQQGLDTGDNDQRRAVLARINEKRAQSGRVVKITSDTRLPFPHQGTVGVCGGLRGASQVKVYWPWVSGSSSLPPSFPYELASPDAG